MKKCLMEWKPISSRVMKIRIYMKEKHVNITIIQCYAKTNTLRKRGRIHFTTICKPS